MKQESRVRITKRILGYLHSRLAELPLDEVPSQRKRKVKWHARTLLTALIVGIVSGCKGLRDVEWLLANALGTGARKLLGLWCRIADTTLDERPWLVAPHGMLIMMLLRRLGYNMLTLFRAVTTRSEQKRAGPWHELVRTIWVSLICATLEVTESIRRREVIVG